MLFRSDADGLRPVHERVDVCLIDSKLRFAHGVADRGQEKAVAGRAAADEPHDWIADRPAEVLVIGHAVQPEDAVVVHQPVRQVHGLAIE